MGLVTGAITAASSKGNAGRRAGLGLASWDSSNRMAEEPPGRPNRVMVMTPAASRQAVKETPNASARPGLDARKPSAGSAAAAMPLLRIGIVTLALTGPARARPPPARASARLQGGGGRSSARHEVGGHANRTPS